MSIVSNTCRVFYEHTIHSENRAVYDIMSKNMVEPERTQMTSQYGACVLHAGQVRLRARAHTSTHKRAHETTHASINTHAHAHKEICNTYCFSTASVVTWTHPNVMLCVHCLSCLYIFPLYDVLYTLISMFTLSVFRFRNPFRNGHETIHCFYGLLQRLNKYFDHTCI